MALPQATQTYNPLLTSGQRVVRQAVRPQHGKKSSEFVAPNEKAWVFRCHASNVKGVKGKTDHYFAARPDPHAPRAPAELASWVQAQLTARATSSPAR